MSEAFCGASLLSKANAHVMMMMMTMIVGSPIGLRSGRVLCRHRGSPAFAQLCSCGCRSRRAFRSYGGTRERETRPVMMMMTTTTTTTTTSGISHTRARPSSTPAIVVAGSIASLITRLFEIPRPNIYLHIPYERCCNAAATLARRRVPLGVSYHIISHHITSHHVASRRVASRHVASIAPPAAPGWVDVWMCGCVDVWMGGWMDGWATLDRRDRTESCASEPPSETHWAFAA